MRLYLVSPTHYLADRRLVKSVRYWTSAVTLPYLKALTPPGHDVTLCDELMAGHDVDLERDCDLVGITAMGPQIARAFDLADAFRARGRTVVLGGPWVSLAPREAQRHADAVVVGEAEPVWAGLLADAAGGRLKRRYDGAFGELAGAPAFDYRELPLFDYPTFQRSRFYRWYFHFPVWTSRGCTHACSYCAVAAYSKQRYRTRPVEDVIRDVQAVRDLGGRRLLILDDNPIGDRDHARELFCALAPFRMQWASQCTIEIARDPELLDLAARSGCRTLTIGLESVGPPALKVVGKRFAAAAQYARDVQAIRRRGIQVIGLFMVGLDGDGPESFAATLRFCVENQLAFLKLFTPCPFPGTPYHRQMKQAGRILTEDWNRYDYGSAIVAPLSMSPTEMMAGFDRLYRDFYRLGSIARRFVPPAPANYAEGLFYAIANLKVAYFLATNPHGFGTISGTHAGRAERLRTVWRRLRRVLPAGPAAFSDHVEEP
ncbi:MAG TPA: radical SAM protein [Polyangia bacterium]